MPDQEQEPNPAVVAIGTIETGLKPLGAYRDTIGPATAAIALTSRFRWRWMATLLHTFIYAAWFHPGTPVETLDQYLAAACQYAIDKKGALRGMQVGVAAVTVAIVDNATAEQVEWAAHPHGRRFAAIAFPVLVDATARRVIRPERMVLGAIYTGYLQELVRTYVETPIST